MRHARNEFKSLEKALCGLNAADFGTRPRVQIPAPDQFLTQGVVSTLSAPVSIMLSGFLRAVPGLNRSCQVQIVNVSVPRSEELSGAKSNHHA